MIADQVIGELRGTLEGNDGDIDSGNRLEQLGCEVAAGAGRRRTDVELAGLLLGDGFVISTIGVEEMRPIGAKSLRGS